MKFYQFTPDNPPKKWKKKMGVIAWDGEDLYIPACNAGMSNNYAFICGSTDGEKVVAYKKSVFIREMWARKEKPGWSEVFDAIHKQALKVKEIN